LPSVDHGRRTDRGRDKNTFWWKSKSGVRKKKTSWG
jgi:hypothetical protein